MPEFMRSRRFVAVARAAGYSLLWLVLMPSLKPADLLFGGLTVIAATMLSLRLFSPLAGEVHLVSLVMLIPHFLWESIVAGFDVARRAFTPQVALDPGFVACPLDLQEGLARNLFATFTSLMPGTVACGEDKGVLVYHCIDMTQPVVEQLWAEEKLLTRAITAGRKHG